MIELIIPGKPVGKKRPRFARRGKLTTTYNDQRTDEDKFILFLRESYSGPVLHGPLRIDCEFVFDRPKAHYGTGRSAWKIKQSSPQYHVIKPDKDNLEKFVLDCMEGIVFKNDSQVYAGETVKRYAGVGESAHTNIRIHLE